MSFYIIANTTKAIEHFCDDFPADEITSVRTRLDQKSFDFMCELFNIKTPCIHRKDSYMLSLTKFAHTWNICDEAVPGGFEITAVLDFDAYPEEEFEEVLRPLIKKYQKRFKD